MFSDIKVVELASVLAGPLVGTFFSELGAEVIKIENKITGGDVTRNWKQSNEEKESSVSAYYASANYNKKVLLKDLTDSNDYEEVMKLIKDADVLIQNFRPGADEKLKLDYKTISEINPQIIYADITGFEKGNYRVAYDVVLQAESGFMSINGEPNAKPLKMPIAMIDILAAHQLKEGILCALIKRMKTGRGSYVHVSLFDAALSSLANQATNWLMNKNIPKPMGSKHPNIAPYGDLFQTKDGKWIVLAIGSDSQFSYFCKVMNMVEYSQSELYRTNQLRLENRKSLISDISSKISEFDAQTLEKELLSKQIPFGIVKNLREVFEDSKAKKLILQEPIDGQDTERVKSVVFNIEE